MGQQTTHMQSGSSVDAIDAKPGEFPECFPDGSPGSSRGISSKDDAYNMSHGHRGFFIIINNKDFHSSTGMAERSGTDMDANYLEELFTSYGFSVLRENNSKVSDMLKIIKNVAAKDHAGVDCFGIAILSHGDEGVIFGIDNFISIDLLFAPIKRCPTLAGKPKLFIIQACRGSQLDDGQMVEADSPGQQARIPIEADCLYAFSTVPGYYSWRNSIRGSWFIQSLYTVFKSEKHTTDVLRLLTRVNRMVAYEFESNASSMAMNHKKQVPYIASTLTKDLYLQSKIR